MTALSVHLATIDYSKWVKSAELKSVKSVDKTWPSGVEKKPSL